MTRTVSDLRNAANGDPLTYTDPGDKTHAVGDLIFAGLEAYSDANTDQVMLRGRGHVVRLGATDPGVPRHTLGAPDDSSEVMGMFLGSSQDGPLGGSARRA